MSANHKFKTQFKNEKGNKISMVITSCVDDDGIECVKIIAKGPHSTVEHVWTVKEAGILVTAISSVTTKILKDEQL